MSISNAYGFNQLVDLCKQTQKQISQTMSAKFASEYQLYLPSKAELKAQLERITQELEGGGAHA